MEAANPLLPWMVKFAFWASIILTVLKIWDLVSKYLERPRLDLKLAPEVFFRLIDTGETIFCNPVFIAWNGPVLITNAKATLEKINEPKKRFKLKIAQYGEKVRGSGVIAEHYFHSKSPITYVSESVPNKLVYMCVQENYESEVKKAVMEFNNDIINLKNTVVSQLETIGDTDKFHLQQEILKSINEIVNKNIASMFQLIQLEPGNYQLNIEINYVDPKKRLRRSEFLESSSITFVVEDSIRKQWMDSLRDTLYTSAENIIFNNQKIVIYPEYQPIKIEPSSEKMNSNFK